MIFNDIGDLQIKFIFLRDSQIIWSEWKFTLEHTFTDERMNLRLRGVFSTDFTLLIKLDFTSSSSIGAENLLHHDISSVMLDGFFITLSYKIHTK